MSRIRIQVQANLLSFIAVSFSSFDLWRLHKKVNCLFECPTHISGALNVKNLSSELSLVNWHQLGIKLGLQPAQLSQIESQHPVDIERRRVDVFVFWLKGNPGASWRHIVTALRKMGELSTAEKIELKYVKGERGTIIQCSMPPLETCCISPHKLHISYLCPACMPMDTCLPLHYGHCI